MPQHSAPIATHDHELALAAAAEAEHKAHVKAFTEAMLDSDSDDNKGNKNRPEGTDCYGLFAEPEPNTGNPGPLLKAPGLRSVEVFESKVFSCGREVRAPGGSTTYSSTMPSATDIDAHLVDAMTDAAGNDSYGVAAPFEKDKETRYKEAMRVLKPGRADRESGVKPAKESDASLLGIYSEDETEDDSEDEAVTNAVANANANVSVASPPHHLPTPVPTPPPFLLKAQTHANGYNAYRADTRKELLAEGKSTSDINALTGKMWKALGPDGRKAWNVAAGVAHLQRQADLQASARETAARVHARPVDPRPAVRRTAPADPRLVSRSNSTNQQAKARQARQRTARPSAPTLHGMTPDWSVEFDSNSNKWRYKNTVTGAVAPVRQTTTELARAPASASSAAAEPAVLDPLLPARQNVRAFTSFGYSITLNHPKGHGIEDVSTHCRSRFCPCASLVSAASHCPSRNWTLSNAGFRGTKAKAASQSSSAQRPTTCTSRLPSGSRAGSSTAWTRTPSGPASKSSATSGGAQATRSLSRSTVRGPADRRTSQQ